MDCHSMSHELSTARSLLTYNSDMNLCFWIYYSLTCLSLQEQIPDPLKILGNMCPDVSNPLSTIIFKPSMNNSKHQVQCVSLWDMLNSASGNFKENMVQTFIKTTTFGHCSL